VKALLRLFFVSDFEINTDMASYKIIRKLEETLVKSKKLAWPWSDRERYSGSVASSSFKLTERSWLNACKPIAAGTLQDVHGHTLVRVRVQPPNACLGLMLISICWLIGGFLAIEGVNGENIPPLVILALLYYLLCLGIFHWNANSTKRKLSTLIAAAKED